MIKMNSIERKVYGRLYPSSYNAERITVSIVIPIRNEEKYIEDCIRSLLLQDFDLNDLEILFVDGQSADKTCTIVVAYCEKYSFIKLLHNRNKTVPYAMNIGIRASTGRYIIRMDAHSTYDSDYITKCVDYLDITGADNVGGIASTKSRTFIGEAIALMLSSTFGVGNSRFRTGGTDGYVDTVPFGAFPREVFDKYGLYDVRLTRNQDNELNYRIRKNGGKIYLANDIRLTYYSRDSLGGIMKMAFQNGCWNIISTYLCPGSMGLRHFIPFIFLLSLILGSLSIWLTGSNLLLQGFMLELICYGMLNVLFSFRCALHSRFIHFPMLMMIFPLFHITYGIGSLIGIIKGYFMKKKEMK